LVLVGALLVLVLAGGGSSRTEDVHVPLEQGASAAVTAETHGQHKITVNQVIDNATSTIQSQPRAGNRLWAIEVAVENPSAREIVVGEWRLRTYDGAEYESEFVSGVTPQLNAVQNLIPGTKTQGIVLLQVPSDAEVRSLRYEPNVVSKGDLYFDAVR
jgi:hypothetical protein